MGGILCQAGTLVAMFGAGAGLFWADRLVVGSERFSWTYAGPILASFIIAAALFVMGMVVMAREREQARIAKIESDADVAILRAQNERLLRIAERKQAPQPNGAAGAGALAAGVLALPTADGLSHESFWTDPIGALREAYERLTFGAPLAVVLSLFGVFLLGLAVLYLIRRYEGTTARILYSKLVRWSLEDATRTAS